MNLVVVVIWKYSKVGSLFISLDFDREASTVTQIKGKGEKPLTHTSQKGNLVVGHEFCGDCGLSSSTIEQCV